MGRLTGLPSALVTDDSALGGLVVERSLRFDKVMTTGNEYISRTQVHLQINGIFYTFSCWYKRCNLTYSLYLMFLRQKITVRIIWYLCFLGTMINLNFTGIHQLVVINTLIVMSPLKNLGIQPHGFNISGSRYYSIISE